MSMFYELMMRRKQENIMYATIKGTLTESPEGVFSGLSNSNYLKLQQNIELNNFEFGITFKTASDISSYSGFLLTNSSGNNVFYIDFNYNRIRFRTTTAEDTTDAYTWWQNLDTDTFYKLVWKYDNSTSTHTYTLIKNGVVVATQTHSATFKGITDTFNFGQSTNVNSIDINNSYIKLGGTKYNLQAVVGYTIIGSPTIVDGVMTNLSSGNGIEVSKAIGNNWETLEFNIEVSLSSLGSGNYGAFFGHTSYLLFREQSYKFSVWYRIDGNSNWKNQTINYTISENTLYKLKLLIKKSTGLFIFTLSQNNNILASINFVDIENIPNFVNKEKYAKVLGNFTVEQINLNNTYTKINNKLWFNGQEG